jgi:hypothetical protein
VIVLLIALILHRKIRCNSQSRGSPPSTTPIPIPCSLFHCIISSTRPRRLYVTMDEPHESPERPVAPNPDEDLLGRTEGTNDQDTSGPRKRRRTDSRIAYQRKRALIACELCRLRKVSCCTFLSHPTFHPPDPFYLWADHSFTEQM